MKKRVLLTSVLTMLCCISLIAGATYALFTSESQVNIAVSSGKVDVVANVKDDSLKIYSAVEDKTGTLVDENGNKYSHQVQPNGVFSNGGSATISDTELILENVTPGDKVEVTVDITNHSTVNVMYHTILKNNDSSNSVLYDALVIDVQPGGSIWSPWKATETAKTKSVVVTIELPMNAQDASLQGAIANIAIVVEAVQANAKLAVDVASETLAVNENHEVTETKAVVSGDIITTIQTGTKLSGDSVTINSAQNENLGEVETEHNISVHAGNSLAVSYNVDVAGLASDNTTPVAVSFFVGKNLEIATVYHKGAAMTAATDGADQTYTYDSVTGNITVYSTTFSPFTVEIKYAGGLGTQEAPYLISTVEQYKNMVSGTKDKKLYYKLNNDLTFAESDAETGTYNNWGKAYQPKRINYIEFDGDNKTITSLSKAWLFDLLCFCTIKNLNVHTQNTLIAQTAALTMENVNIHGEMQWSGGNHGAYVIYAQQGVTLKNCTNYAKIIATGDDKSYNALFVGYPLSDASLPQTLKFENCKNAGEFVSGLAAMFVANASQIIGKSTTLEIINCGNIDGGEIRGTIVKKGEKINPFVAIAEKNMGTITVDGQETLVTDCDAMGAGFFNGPNDIMNLTLAEDGTLTFNKSQNTNVAYYVVSVGLYTHWVSGVQSGSNRVYATQRIEATEEASYNSTLKNLSFVDQEWVDNHSTAVKGDLAGNTIYTLSGVSYYFISVDGCSVGGVPKPATIFSVSAYAEDGTLISSVGLAK